MAIYDMMIKKDEGEDDHNIAEAEVTRAFCVGGRTSTSGAVALSRTLVSSWSGYCHH